ncbi:MAG: hypothetical protein R6X25_04895 [Candidatus Krumholzibacteriia bacterium]
MMSKHRISRSVPAGTRRPGAIRRLVAGALLAALAVLVACSSSTDPNEDTIVNFQPAAEHLDLLLLSQTTFRVLPGAGIDPRVEFRRGDQLVASSREYVYVADRLGPDSLTAIATMGDRTESHHWRIDVQTDPEGRPPAVTGLSVRHGAAPTSVVLTWDRPSSTSLPTPLERFLVGVSHAGALVDTNWSTADGMREVPYGTTGSLQSVALTAADGLRPGEDAWFAVRAQDVTGRLSPLAETQNERLRVSAPYLISGYVRDDTGAPVAGATVAYGCDVCKVTAASDGSFEMGPFHDFQKFLLTTLTHDDEPPVPGRASYYDLVAHPDRADSIGIGTPQPVELMLIRRYGVDAEGTGTDACCFGAYGDRFIRFFRDLTRTDGAHSGNVQLHRWESFPVPVWIPEDTMMNDDQTVDLAAVADSAITLWNSWLGEDYVVRVASPPALGIIFDLRPGNAGEAVLIDPPNADLGLAVPRVIMVMLEPDLGRNGNFRYALEIMTHEFGHALGISDHSSCGGSWEHCHLMDPIPDGTFAEVGAENALSADERRVLRLVRRLPQGFPLTSYESQ